MTWLPNREKSEVGLAPHTLRTQDSPETHTSQPYTMPYPPLRLGYILTKTNDLPYAKMPTKCVYWIAFIITLCPLYGKGQSLRSAPGDSLYLTSRQEVMTTPKTKSSLMQQSLRVSLPMLALSLPYNLPNGFVRGLRNDYLPHFRHRFDDYLQFAPLATQLGMFTLGLRGESRSLGQVLTTDALAIGLMMTSVTLGKQLTRVERPDGSARNSYPSGHTAMAFTAATLLHLEYGRQYPWLSALGYLSAGAVGFGRIANNRHWLGDVLTGLNVGILSGELAYYLSGLLYGRSYTHQEPPSLLPNTDLRLSLPWFVGLHGGGTYRSGGVGLGLRWAYSKRNYFIETQVSLEHYQTNETEDNTNALSTSALSLSWGKSWALPHKLSLDLSAGLAWERGGHIYPVVQLSPRWSFSSRLGGRFFVRYAHAPHFGTVSRGIKPEKTQSKPRLQGAYKTFPYGATHQAESGASLMRPRWHIGSSLELRL